jgi:hypothetical protein
MPTKHPRLNVTKDPALARAIARSRPLLNATGEARIVHDLAIRGAEALAADEEIRAKAIEELVRLSTDPDSELDREALLDVRRTAWRTCAAHSAAASSSRMHRAWARADRLSLRRRFGAALRIGQIATCAIVSLEFLHSARNGAELDERMGCSRNCTTSPSDAL